MQKENIIYILGGILFIWVLFVLMPTLNEDTIRKENLKKLEECLQEQDDLYYENWNNSCKKEGKKNDCYLTDYSAKTVEKWKVEGDSKCYKKYPQKNQ